MNGQPLGCAAYDPEISPTYGYAPSEAVGIVFVVLFGTSTVLHVGQATWKRQWWAYVFAVGSLIETFGWSARLWSAKCPYEINPFLIQLTVLIIAPTFYTAGLYVILGLLVNLMGSQTSPLSQRGYLWIFCSADIISLVIQAAGGGIAAGAFLSVPMGNMDEGTNIIVAGILFQMASVAVFTVFFGIFCFRVRKQKIFLSMKTKVFLAATAISILMIYIRSIYRTVEMLEGWTGYLLNHEVYFIVLDGAMMVVCGGIFNLVNPGWFLEKGKESRMRDSSSMEMTDPVTLSF